jgi:hypothetical protein
MHLSSQLGKEETMKANWKKGKSEAYPVMTDVIIRERELHKNKEIVSLSQSNWKNDNEGRTIHSYGQDFGQFIVKTERKA